MVTKLVVQIDDRIVEAKIKAKEEAKEQYGDAIAAGNTAVFAERSGKDNDIVTLKIGNLLPQQTAVLDLQFIKPMKVSGGAYEFVLPVSFLPLYKSHKPVRTGVSSEVDLVPEYTFQYGF